MIPNLDAEGLVQRLDFKIFGAAAAEVGRRRNAAMGKMGGT